MENYIDYLIEKAFSDGYEYAQREFNKRIIGNLASKKSGQKVVKDIEGYFKGLNGGKRGRMSKKSQLLEVLEGPNSKEVTTTLGNGHKEAVNGTYGYTVKNHGPKAGPESWKIDPETFNKKYEPTKEHGIYRPKGNPMQAKRINENIEITPKNWGGYKQNLKQGDYLLTDGKGDTYGIGAKEFRNTYGRAFKSNPYAAAKRSKKR